LIFNHFKNNISAMAKIINRNNDNENFFPSSEGETTVAETVVGHSVKIEGDLVSDGDIKIDGQVVGKIKTSQNLFVGPTAKIEADVEAGNATIAGKIAGNLKVREVLAILQTGNVAGDIDCGKLAVEEGAFFSGKCTMNVHNGYKTKPISEPVLDED
jgi:cytoskeletal protein CcmA (bactofilin family)